MPGKHLPGDYRDAARVVYGHVVPDSPSDVAIDDVCTVNVLKTPDSEDGAWVQAWVWVRDDVVDALKQEKWA